MKVRKPRKLLAAVLSVVLALAMTVGVVPVTKVAKAAGVALGDGNTFEITYHLNDGTSASPATITIPVEGGDPSKPGVTTSGTKITLTGGDGAFEDTEYSVPEPVRPGYDFEGWVDADPNDDSKDPQAVTNPIELSEGSGEIEIWATWSAITYTATYNVDGGTLADGTTDSQEFTVEDLDDLDIADPSKAGYDFGGWTFVRTSEDDPPVETDVDVDDITVADVANSGGTVAFTANWSVHSYDIAYADADNHPVSPDGDPPTTWTVTGAETMTLPAAKSDPATGYAFAGWTDGSNVYAAGATYTFNRTSPANITFTETWAGIEHTLTLTGLSDLDEASQGILTDAGYAYNATTGTATKKFTEPSAVTLPVGLVSTDDSQSFNGWTIDSSSATGWVANAKTEDVIAAAVWEPVLVADFVDAEGNTVADSMEFVPSDSSIDLPSVPAKTGYHGGKWKVGSASGEDANSSYDVSGATENITFVAVYEANSFTITLDVDRDTVDDATISATGFTDSNDDGVFEKTVTYSSTATTFSLEGIAPTTATHGNAYEFGGWTLSGNAVTSIDLADLDNGATVTVTANWLEKYTVEYNLNGGSYNSETSYTDNLTSATLADPSAYTAIVPTLSGSTLTKWTLAGTNVTAGDISVSDPTAGQTIDLTGIQPGDTVTLTAGWTASYTVTYLDDDDTPLTLTPSYYLTGTTSITLPAVPTRTGYAVTWSDGVDNDLAGGSSYSIPTTEANLTFTAVYEKTPFTITLTGVSGTDNISAVTTAGFTADSSNYVKTVYIDTTSFTLPTLPDDTTAHMAFKGWRETGSSDEPATITIANTAASASYEPVFAAVPTVTINFTLGTDGEFSTADLDKLTALGGDATGVTLYADQDADDLAALAIIPAPVKTSGDDIFSGWTVSGDSSGAKVMEYEVPAFSTTSNPTVTLTANWTSVADGETEVLAEGADAGTIDASTATALEGILDVDPGAKAIVKMDVEEADHTGGAINDAISSTLAGATGVGTAYLNIDITKYVTTSTQNSEKTEIADLGEVLDIVYDPTGNIPTGKTLDDLGLVVRYHNGQSQTFTKLIAQPASGEEVDGTYWVDSANSLIHIYNRFFSTFALAYTPTLYDVTFDADGGTPVASIRTNKLPSPSAMPTTTKSGYDFNGWFDGNGTQYTGGETITADLALKAKWTKQSTGGGGSGGGSGGGGTTPPSPTPTASADPSPTPTGSPEVSPTPTTDPTTEPTTPPAPLAKGKKFKTSNGMTLISNGDGTAKLSKYKGSGKSLTVDTAKDANGYKYKITSIAAKAAKGNKKLTKLTIGVNVAKIGDYAFYGCEHLGWVYVKSLKLTKASRVGKKSFGKTKKKALFKLKKKYFKKTKAAFKKKSGAKKPRYKKV